MKRMKTAVLILTYILFTTGAMAQQAKNNKKPIKKIIQTNKAPLPIGPYSQGVVANGFLFVAGQVGSNPQTRQLVTESFEAEATQVLENIKAILQAAGLDFKHVVKATIYVKGIGQFAKVNEIYGKYFTTEPPARETVQVANLPGNANIEISVIAVME
ncbi:MAG: RidA family protein [Adhaeribacter sp.]|nr:RidA family protein [Adhaeribacter sp.]